MGSKDSRNRFKVKVGLNIKNKDADQRNRTTRRGDARFERTMPERERKEKIYLQICDSKKDGRKIQREKIEKRLAAKELSK